MRIREGLVYLSDARYLEGGRKGDNVRILEVNVRAEAVTVGDEGLEGGWVADQDMLPCERTLADVVGAAVVWAGVVCTQ